MDEIKTREAQPKRRGRMGVPSTIALAKPVCKVWPNGEFSVGLDSSGTSPIIPPRGDQVENIFWENATDEAKAWMKQAAAERVSELGLSIPPNSPRARRGLNGITTYGARLVRNAAYLMQEKLGRENLGFITLTLPSLSKEDMESVCLNWHTVVKAYFKRIGRLYERKVSRKMSWVACTEVQEQRYDGTGFLGLHLHYVYLARVTGNYEWATTKDEIRDTWKRSIEEHCSGEYDFSASENCSTVRRSASDYLGKYLSKGVKAVGRIRAKGDQALLPHAWYSISRRLLRAVKRRVIRSALIGRALSRRLGVRDTTSYVAYFAPIIVETRLYGDRIFGWYGRFLDTFDNSTECAILGQLEMN